MWELQEAQSKSLNGFSTWLIYRIKEKPMKFIIFTYLDLWREKDNWMYIVIFTSSIICFNIHITLCKKYFVGVIGLASVKIFN